MKSVAAEGEGWRGVQVNGVDDGLSEVTEDVKVFREMTGICYLLPYLLVSLFKDNSRTKYFTKIV